LLLENVKLEIIAKIKFHFALKTFAIICVVSIYVQPFFFPQRYLKNENELESLMHMGALNEFNNIREYAEAKFMLLIFAMCFAY
jgi:hypothetical protein